MSSSNFSFSLSLSPPEVLSLILDDLPAPCIGRLHLCGDKRLINNLTVRGAVKRFFFEMGPMIDAMPSLVYQLAGLEVLSLVRIVPELITTISNIHVEQLPKTLREIHFEFPGSLTPFLDVPESTTEDVMLKDLKTLLPNLKSWKYAANPLRDLPKTWWPLFPSQLMSLNFKQNFLASDIQFLPRQLQYLRIYRLDSDIHWKEDPMWPPVLLKLLLKRCTSCVMYKHLPRNLEHLEVEYGGGKEWYKKDSKKSQGWRWLPSNLTYLSVESYVGPVVRAKAVQMLPRTILQLKLSTLRLDFSLTEFPALLASLPPHLQHIQIFQGFKLPQMAHSDKEAFRMALQRFPQSLTSTDQYFADTFQSIAWFPPSLTKLTLRAVNRRICELLPATLTFFYCDTLCDPNEPIMSLEAPLILEYRNLLSLLSSEPGQNQLAGEGNEKRTTFAPWHFPPSLQALAAINGLSISAMYAVCRHTQLIAADFPYNFHLRPYLMIQRKVSVYIEEPLLDLHSPLLACWNPVLFSELTYFRATIHTVDLAQRLVQLFPNCLQTLNIQCRTGFLPPGAILLLNKTKFPVLYNLTMGPFEKLENSHFDHLPPLLISLAIHGTTTPIYTSQCTLNLPKMLVFLHLPYLDEHDGAFAHLTSLSSVVFTNHGIDGTLHRRIAMGADQRDQMAAERQQKFRGWF